MEGTRFPQSAVLKYSLESGDLLIDEIRRSRSSSQDFLEVGMRQQRVVTVFISQVYLQQNKKKAEAESKNCHVKTMLSLEKPIKLI